MCAENKCVDFGVSGFGFIYEGGRDICVGKEGREETSRKQL